MEIENLLQRFDNSRRAGDGQWSARCPVHGDNHNSLCIGIGDDGRCLVHCQVGCAIDDVLAAVSLTNRDLFPSSNGNGYHKASESKIIATYDYRDETGKLEFQAVRKEPKGFYQRRPNPDGEGWINNVQGCRVLPFHLPELKASPDVTLYIPEGEKDCQSLDRIGLLATCNAGGAQKWKAAHAQPLAGRDIVILPDNDPPGRSHGQQVAQSLVGVARSIKVITLPGLKEKGDVSDWIAAGGTREQLLELVAAAPEWTPQRSESSSSPDQPEVRAGTASSGKVITYRRITAAELDAAEFTTEYLIEWLLVAGQPCVIAGPKKACKTTILCALAIALTIGGKFLGMFNVTRCCRVLFMSGESGLATLQETLRRIAHANGHFLSDISGLIISDQLPVLGKPDYMAALREMIVGDEIEILILDPAYLCLPTDGNEASLFAMGALLRGISELCQELGVTLVLCHHTKKGIADPYQPPELEGIAWSGFQEWARQWLLLGRRERYEPGTGKHELWLSAGGSAGHSSLWALNILEGAFTGNSPRGWQVDVMRPDEAIDQAHDTQADRRAAAADKRRDAMLEADRKAVVKVLNKLPAGETKNVLRDRTGIRSGRIDAAVASLLEDNTLEPCEVTRANKQSYDGFKINPATTKQ